jgi:DNA polymerase
MEFFYALEPSSSLGKDASMSLSAAGMLKQYLEQRQASGQTHAPLRPGVLDRLRSSGKAAPTLAPEARRTAVETPNIDPAPRPAHALFEMPVAVPSRLPQKAAGILAVPGQNKVEKLSALAAMAEKSTQAKTLGTLRETMVFAVGNPDASIMLIGEAPGFEEERQREPFVGPAGQKLNGILKAMGLDRSQVYISNICKFRPAIEGNQGTSNRAPTDNEMAACLSFVLTEIAIVAPQVIVALGGVACKGLGIGEGVMRLRGRFYDVHGVPTMVTYHPSYLLREEKMAGGGLRAKRECWEDMLKVMEKAGLSISEKQRGYFRQ